VKPGKFITRPAYIKSSASLMPCNFISGAVYCEAGSLVPESQRQFVDKNLHLNDSPFLPLIHSFKRIESSQPTLYLGNHFSHYGHFIMETLPMMSYVLGNKKQCFFNHLPFGKNQLVRAQDGTITNKTDFRLLKYFCEIFDISFSRVIVNYKSKIPHGQNILSTSLGHDYIGNFEILSRPTIMNDKLVDRRPFDKVAQYFEKKIPNTFCGNVIKSDFSKLFLARSPKFYSEELSLFIERVAKDNGFVVVYLEKLCLEDQIKLIRNAREVMGFCGSQLHNVIFGRKIEKVIEIGRIKGAEVNPNQKICSQISQSSLEFCPMTFDEQMRDCINNLARA